MTLPARDRPFKRKERRPAFLPQVPVPNSDSEFRFWILDFTPAIFISWPSSRAVSALLIYPSRFYPKIFDPRKNDMDYPEITHLSLCSGYGGIDLGLKRMLRGARTVAYAEIDEFASGVLAARMEGGQLDPAPIWPDVKSFPYSDFHGKVDILSAGYPCQPFSQAGLQLGAADPRHLWPAIATGIRLVRPGFVFLENVQGHLALGLDAVLRDLQRAGYRSTFGLFSAAEVGACHERKRVFVLAHSVCERGLVSFERVVSAIQDAGGESQTGRTADGWSDHTGWAIEPCVRGGDDGAANRVDRLRLLGNGVVPAVAERAFRVLLAQLFL